jgi:hypothetical protein
MNVALILSTLVIGASTLNSPGGSGLLAPPNSDLPLPPIQNNTNSQQAQTRTQRAEQEHNAQRKQTRATHPYGYYSSSQRQNSQNRSPVMPVSPTDSSAGSQVGQYYNYLPPTANAGVGQTGGGYAGLPGPTDVPTSPTRARPGESQSYSSMRTAEEQNRRQAASRNAASAPVAAAPKPFAGVNTTSSAPSPYMNLFRTGNNNGTIDNYTTLVRPELDQQRANQKFGADIHGLENSTHVQGLNIRQLNRETQTLQGVNATQYFMNYGDYYKDAR